MRVGLLAVAVAAAFCFAEGAVADELPAGVAAALQQAGDNRLQLEEALRRTPTDQAAGLHFLLENMPQRDLKSLSADFLLENADYAYRAWREAPWRDRVPEDVFLNNVLPYANINERRDSWRKDFFERCRPLAADCDSPALAAARLNQKLFSLVNVRYSTQRPKADQSPYESIQAGLASCSGLAVLLVDACRAVGIPARFAGTPLWSDNSGNHSWVEVWDEGWHFTGAAEPAGDKLDEAWFIGRAAGAKRDHPRHAIFAVSFKRTPQHFPLVWDPGIDDVYAVNVTDRYTGLGKTLPAGQVRVMFRALSAPNGNRCCAKLTIRDGQGKVVAQEQTNDERFDANDHVVVPLAENGQYEVEVSDGENRSSTALDGVEEGQLVTVELPAAPDKNEPAEPAKNTGE